MSSFHSKNLEALLLARSNGVILLQLPAHTTHRLQPFDVAFLKSLQTYYDQAVQKWLRNHPGLTVTMFQVAGLLGEAYERAAVISTASNGFRKSGVYPVDRTVFSDQHFMASDILNQSNGPDSVPSTSSTDRPIIAPVANTVALSDKHLTPERTAVLKVTLSDISPDPVVERKKGRARSAGIAGELTASPYKNSLISANEKRVRPSKMLRSPTQLQEVKQIRKSQGESTWFCNFCEEVSIEDMIQCMKCKSWYIQNVRVSRKE